MNYLLLVYRDENDTGLDAEGIKGCEGLAERLHAKGLLVSGGILQPTNTATSVQMRDGKRLVTDGPFAETREQLAGFMLVQANDLDEAIAIAAEHPVARIGTV